MVLKNARFSANTGATQRKSPFLKPVEGPQPGFITKQGSVHADADTSVMVGASRRKQNRYHKLLFDDIDGGLPCNQVGVRFSIKKKQRWLIPDLLKETILEISSCASEKHVPIGTGKKNSKLSRSRLIKKKSKMQPINDSEETILDKACVNEKPVPVGIGKNNSKLSRPRVIKKKSKIQPKNDSVDNNTSSTRCRTVLVEKGLLHSRFHVNENHCKAVYDSGDLEKPVKKSKSWRCNVKNFLQDEDSIDIKYEVTNQLALIGRASGADSKYQKQNVRYYKEAKKGKHPRRQKNRHSIHIRQLKDDLDILDNGEEDTLFTDTEESYLMFDEAVENIGKTENRTLKDFFINTSRHPKCKAPYHCARYSTQGQDIQYSNNHASSQLVLCIPKNNVMPHVPEAHKLIDEISSIQQSSSFIMTPTAVIVEEDVNKCSKDDPTFEEFTVDIIGKSLDKKKLAQNYGKAYVEGRSYPRCFAIFINQVRKFVHLGSNIVIVANIRNGVPSEKDIRNGVPTEKELELLEVVPVQLKVFNAKCGSLKFLLEETQSKLVYDFLCVVRRIMDTCFPYSPDIINIKSTQIPDVIQKLVTWKTRPIMESEAFDLVFDRVAHSGMKSINTTSTMDYVKLDEPVCLVCYTKLFLPTSWYAGSVGNYSRADEGAALSSCCHWLCKYCWKHYLDIKMNEGSLKIECPFTDCKHTVDIVTCLSFSSHSSVSKYLRMKFESEVQSDPSLQWCPGCEKAAVCENVKKSKAEKMLKDIPYVSCSCNRTWCFSCQGQSHWPIPCHLYSKYKVKRDKIYEEGVSQLVVKVKPCPSCKIPIDKSDGCNFLYCRCGQYLCWNCMKIFIKVHYSPCVELKVKTHVFSNYDIYGESKKRAFNYQLQIKSILNLRKTLGLEKSRESGTQPSTVHPRHGVIRKAIDLQIECCSVLEYVALAITQSKSRGFNRRLTKFCDKFDSLLKKIVMTLCTRNPENNYIGYIYNYVQNPETILYVNLTSFIKETEEAMLVNIRNPENINYVKLTSLIKETEEAMLGLKYFGL